MRWQSPDAPIDPVGEVDRARGTRRRWLGALTQALVLAAAGSGAHAQSLGIELNRVDPIEGGCRVHLVLDNPQSRRFSALQLDLVLFDRDGIIGDRLALEVAPLRGRKIAVREFDLPGRRCEDFGRLLLNDIVRCESEPAATGDCMDAVSLSSRVDVPFVR